MTRIPGYEWGRGYGMCCLVYAAYGTSRIVTAMGSQRSDYEVDVIRVSPHHSATLVRTGPTTGAPSTFSTTCYVDEGKLAVLGVITVIPGGQAVMVEMTVHSGPAAKSISAPVTTSSLRRILVDQIVRAAVAEATVEMPPDDEGGPSKVGERMQSATQSRAADAAKIYLDAQAKGSKAPTEAVAAEMGVSRPQASRYVRAAREAGLLPPAGLGGNARVPYGHLAN